jgi:hypothetical protein
VAQLTAMSASGNAITIQRHVWTILRDARDVHRAAKERQTFHEKRAKLWKGRRDKTERALRKHGIKIIPDLFNATTSIKYSGAKHEKVDVNHDLLLQLNNENGKVEEHKQRAREYAKFVSFLGHLSPGYVLDLTIYDAEWFGIVKDKLADEEVE